MQFGAAKERFDGSHECGEVGRVQERLLAVVEGDGVGVVEVLDCVEVVDCATVSGHGYELCGFEDRGEGGGVEMDG